MSKMFKAVFPDRLAPKDNSLPLNYMSPITVQDRQTSMMIRASNKREAWRELHRAFPYERIVIEEANDD